MADAISVPGQAVALIPGAAGAGSCCLCPEQPFQRNNWNISLLMNAQPATHGKTDVPLNLCTHVHTLLLGYNPRQGTGVPWNYLRPKFNIWHRLLR